MVLWWFHPPSVVLLFSLSLTSCLTTSNGALAKYRRVDNDSSPPVTTSLQGTLQGINMLSRMNRTFYAFKGIPYAEPPVGDLRFDQQIFIFDLNSQLNIFSIGSQLNIDHEFHSNNYDVKFQSTHTNHWIVPTVFHLMLGASTILQPDIRNESYTSTNRFKAPAAAGNWTGTFNASSDSNLCPQISSGSKSVVGSEDCLYLHVYTPKLPASDNATLLPVMVYLFGGRFEIGNNNDYAPNFLLDKDVVYVAPNFRLGLLGYLTTGDEVSPGNYGLKDIVLVLEWIQDNIQYFGGDPKQVTLFGQSAGAMSISLLVLADSTKGLFHRIITESGTALNLELTPSLEVHVNRTYQLAEYFACPTTTSQLLVDCLRGINMTQIVDTKSLFYEWESFPMLIWFPTSEPDIEGALFTEPFAKLFAAGKRHDVPWICSVSQVEEDASSFRGDSGLLDIFLNNLDTALPYVLGYWSSVDATAYTNRLKSYYFNDLTANKSELVRNISAMISDAKFFYPAHHMLHQRLHTEMSPLYFTVFEYLGSSTNKRATTHGEELPYLFPSSDGVYSDDDWSMVETLVQLWTSFAIDGTPTVDGSSNTILWEPYSSLNNYLRIGNGSDATLGMEYDFYMDRMQFWNKLVSSSTSGKSQNQLPLIPIILCLSLHSAVRQL